MSAHRPSVAIDGPVAAGKSTMARRVAQGLGFIYIDTGAMYRALGWAARRAGVTGDEPQPVIDLLSHLRIELRPQPDGTNQVLVDGQDITGEIRSPDIGELASKLSTLPAVRRRLVALQQEMAAAGGVVMEGRDIQTVVLPQAEVKIFLTASAEERARRRWEELRQRGFEAKLEDVLAEIEARDRRDTTREDSPLKPAPDAVHVNTDGLTIEQVVDRVLAIAREKTAAPHK